MKKFIYLFALVLTFASCSTDEPDLMFQENLPSEPTVTPAPPFKEASPQTTEVATAQAPEVKVHASAAMRATFEELKSSIAQSRAPREPVFKQYGK